MRVSSLRDRNADHLVVAAIQGDDDMAGYRDGSKIAA
jgi:hypothetical protein